MLEALAQQKVLPGLRRLDSELYARWLPLLDGHRIDRLAGAMPPVCRAAAQQVLSPRDLLESFLEETTDALVREWGSEPGPLQNPSEPGSRWLAALFGEQDPISASAAQLESLERSHNIWLRNLKLAGDEHFRVAFRVSEPGREEDIWSLEFALQAKDDLSLLVPAGDVWRGNVSVRRLRDPQEKLLTGLGACLADDMGLGKTLQTLILLSRDRQRGLLQAPALIVYPTSVVSNWHKEAERFTPDLRVLAHQGRTGCGASSSPGNWSKRTSSSPAGRSLDHRALRPGAARDGDAQEGGDGMSFYEWYPESRPIATDRGLKARSKRGEFAKNWWAARWIGALEPLMDANRLRRGRRYARQGQVLSVEEQTGGVVAMVQGSRSRPYRVDVALEPLSEDQWERVTAALSERALFSAQLLAGEMPKDIEEAFRVAGVSLFPDRRGQLRTSCSCPDSAQVCKHVAAVHYILGDRFDEDSFLLFRLRGRTEEQLTRSLRTRRGQEDVDDEEAADLEQEVPPLEEELDGFWKAKAGLDTVKVAIKPPLVELSVLRRLGQPGFIGQDLRSLLVPTYESVSRSALRMGQGEEEYETPDDAHLPGDGA